MKPRPIPSAPSTNEAIFLPKILVRRPLLSYYAGKALSIILSGLVELFLRLERIHLVVILRGRVEFADSADIVGGVARNTDVPVALEDDLDVADVERVGAAKLGHLAGGGRDGVNKLIDELEDGLWGNMLASNLQGLLHKTRMRDSAPACSQEKY